MAFLAGLSGDRFNWGFNLVPKVAASGYTSPAVGDAVKMSAGAANEVTIISSTDATYGLVMVVGADGVLTVAVLLPGTQVEWPTASAPALGNHVKFSTNTRPASGNVQRTVMVGHASDGNGTVVAVGADCPHGVGHCVVEYS